MNMFGFWLGFFSSFGEPSGLVKSLQCFSTAVSRTDIGIQGTVARVEVIYI